MSASSAVATLKPLIWTTVPCLRADADRVNVDAGGRGDLGDRERVGPATCSRRPTAGRSRTSRRSRSSTVPASLSSADWSIFSGLPAIALSDVKRPSPSDVPPPTESRLIAASTACLVVARRQDRDGAVAERHHADLDRPRLSGHEGAGSDLRRLDPRRLQVLGEHAVRDVEGEDHGALALRHAPRSRSVGRARRRPARSPPRRSANGMCAPARVPRRRRSARALPRRAALRAAPRRRSDHQ